MNFIQAQLATLAANPHTSTCAIIYLVCKFGAPVAAVWFPEHTHQINVTANCIEGGAVAWGLLKAKDAKANPQPTVDSPPSPAVKP